jgi:hypothetical protein
LDDIMVRCRKAQRTLQNSKISGEKNPVFEAF